MTNVTPEEQQAAREALYKKRVTTTATTPVATTPVSTPAKKSDTNVTPEEQQAAIQALYKKRVTTTPTDTTTVSTPAKKSDTNVTPEEQQAAKEALYGKGKEIAVGVFDTAKSFIGAAVNPLGTAKKTFDIAQEGGLPGLVNAVKSNEKLKNAASYIPLIAAVTATPYYANLIIDVDTEMRLNGEHYLMAAIEGAKDGIRNPIITAKALLDESLRQQEKNFAEHYPDVDMNAILKNDKAVSEFLGKIADAGWLKPGEYEQLEGASGIVQTLVRQTPKQVMGILLTKGFSVKAGMANTFAQVFGNSYDRKINDEIDADIAFEASLWNATTQAALDYFSLSRLKKIISPSTGISLLKPGVGLVRSPGMDFLKALGSEFMIELIQEYPDAFSDVWAKAQMTGLDFNGQVEQFWGNIGQTTRDGIEAGLYSMFFVGVAGALSSTGVYNQKPNNAVNNEMLIVIKDKQLPSNPDGTVYVDYKDNTNAQEMASIVSKIDDVVKTEFGEGLRVDASSFAKDLARDLEASQRISTRLQKKIDAAKEAGATPAKITSMEKMLQTSLEGQGLVIKAIDTILIDQANKTGLPVNKDTGKNAVEAVIDNKNVEKGVLPKDTLEQLSQDEFTTKLDELVIVGKKMSGRSILLGDWFTDLIDIQAAYRRVHAAETGRRVQNFHSHVDSVLAWSFNEYITKVNSFKFTEQENRDVMYYSEKPGKLNELSPELQARYRPAIEIINKYYKEFAKKSKDAGLFNEDFVSKVKRKAEEDKVVLEQRLLNEKDTMSAGDKKTVRENINNFGSIIKMIAQTDFQYIPLPVKMWMHDKLSKFNDNLSIEIADTDGKEKFGVLKKNSINLNKVFFTERDTIDVNNTINHLLDIGAINRKDINPAMIMADYAFRVSKKLALKDILNSAAKERMLITGNRKSQDTTGKYKDYVKVSSDDGKAFGYSGYYVHPLLMKQLKFMQGTNFNRSSVPQYLSAIKTWSFAQPLRIVYNDIQQAFAAGSLRNFPGMLGFPAKVARMGLKQALATSPGIKAIIDVTKHTPDYYEAMKNGLFAQTHYDNYEHFLYKVANDIQHGNDPLQSRLSRMAKSLLEAKDSISKNPGIINKTLAVGQVVGGSVLSIPFQLYKVGQVVSWQMGDHPLRMLTYNHYRSLGDSSVVAAAKASAAHGNYSSLPEATRRYANYFLYTPSYAAAMTKEQVSGFKDGVKSIFSLKEWGKVVNTMKQQVLHSGDLQGDTRTDFFKKEQDNPKEKPYKAPSSAFFFGNLITSVALNAFYTSQGYKTLMWGYKWYKEEPDENGKTIRRVITQAYPGAMMQRVLYNVAYGMEDTRGVEKIIKLIPTNLHPWMTNTERTIDALYGKTEDMYGNTIKNNFDSNPKQTLDTLKYIAQVWLPVVNYAPGFAPENEGKDELNQKGREEFGWAWNIIRLFASMSHISPEQNSINKATQAIKSIFNETRKYNNNKISERVLEERTRRIHKSLEGIN